MQNVYGSKRFTPVETQLIRLNVYEFDKTYNYTLQFCIQKSLKSLQIVFKSSQITPEVPKIMHFFTGPHQTIFLHCPPPLPKLRETLHTSNGATVTGFGFKREKNYQCSQLGKIDPKNLSEYGVN